jgi:photosystem II stability/assembly factor-like uncharacterized protein
MKTLLYVTAFVCIAFSSSAQWNPVYIHADTKSELAVPFGERLVCVTNYGGRIHYSEDGGDSWGNYQTPFTTSWFSDVQFPSDSIGYACGGTAFGDHRSIVVRSSDSGITWDSITANILAPYSLNQIHFHADNYGFVAGEGFLYKTTDGGQTFTATNLPNNETVTEISSVGDSYFFGSRLSLGSDTYVYSINRYDVLTDTWSLPYTDTMMNVSGWNNRIINKIDFPPNQNLTGYAAGGSGLILKTEDGGSSWAAQFLAPYNYLTGLDFVSETHGYVNNAGGIYTTTDGGANWVIQQLNPPSTISRIEMADANTGYALGNNAVYRTQNGGFLSLDSQELIDNVLVYPNPSNSNITISSETYKIHSVQIIEPTGQLIYEGNYDGLTDINVDVSSFSKGMKIIKLYSENALVSVSHLILE